MAPRPRIPLPSAPEGPARQAGHRPSEIPNDHIRPRMLLAPARGVSYFVTPKDKRRVLGKEHLLCPQYWIVLKL